MCSLVSLRSSVPRTVPELLECGVEGLTWNMGSVLQAVRSWTFGAKGFSPSRKVVLRLVWEEINLEA